MAVKLPVQSAERPARIQSDPRFSGSEDRDEIWEGVTVVSPLANLEHQIFVGELTGFLILLVNRSKLGFVVPGCNVSDRDEGWTENFRIPDIAVFLHGGVGANRGAHLLGGPDFLIEVLSDDDRAPEKLPFYAANGVHEALYIRRDPWVVELYRNVEGILTLAETSTAETEAIVTCSVVPMAVRLIRDAEGSRPDIEISQIGGDLRTVF